MKRLWLLYIVLILGISSIPGRSTPGGVPFHADKIAHAIIYAGLGLIFVLEEGGDRSWTRSLLSGLLLAAAVGLVDELYQGLIPNRTQEFADWLADLGGGLAGGTAGRLWRLRAGKAREETA